MALTPPRSERLTLPGPAGPIEALIDVPAGAEARSFAVICHPHPLYGGTLDNKVVFTLARACGELGVPAIRFNFRGVGGSAGQFDEGVGETEDVRAVIEFGRQRFPQSELWLAGFSFGGAVAIHAASDCHPGLLIAVSPAVMRLEHRLDVDGVRQRHCPWLIVQGDADEVIDAEAVRSWAAQVSPPPELLLMKGASHFFHGRLHELRGEVVNFARRHASA